jgi:hypothetical protein
MLVRYFLILILTLFCSNCIAQFGNKSYVLDDVYPVSYASSVREPNTPPTSIHLHYFHSDETNNVQQKRLNVIKKLCASSLLLLSVSQLERNRNENVSNALAMASLVTSVATLGYVFRIGNHHKKK